MDYKNLLNFAFALLLLAQETTGLSDDAIFNLLLVDYNKFIPPKNSSATSVQIGIYLNDFHSISEATMDYSVNLYIRERWFDARLNFTSYVNDTVKPIKLPDGAWFEIWTPDVFFRNEKQSRFHKVTTPNRLVKVFADGTVLYVIKLSVTLGCQMCLKKFPLDVQTCPMMLESFGYTKDVIDFTWLGQDKPVEVDKLVQIPQFKLARISRSDCSQTYLSGQYPCLKIQFHLHRNIGYYVTQIYVPSFLIVILSWVGFWISADSTPARVSLGLLTILTITTERSVATRSLPPISYTSAMDIWMSGCLLFVFASFLEFALVNHIWNRKQPRQLHKVGAAMCDRQEYLAMLSVGFANTEDLDHEKKVQEETVRKIWKDGQRGKAIKIDNISRWLFPVIFLAFNAGYWPMFLVEGDAHNACE